MDLTQVMDVVVRRNGMGTVIIKHSLEQGQEHNILIADPKNEIKGENR